VRFTRPAACSSSTPIRPFAYHRAEFEPSRRTILYCASGGRSALAVESLRQLGYTNIAHLDGGIKGWAAGGREVTRD
jgi:rhodanese-related sulfurtransferase